MFLYQAPFFVKDVSRRDDHGYGQANRGAPVSVGGSGVGG
jgi:hypothetical protein